MSSASAIDVRAEAAGLAARLLAGDRGALARLISWAENGAADFRPALAAVYARVGRARRTGITGPPGAGKSTLVNALIGRLRARQRTVGVVAVDPTSPITGGALLGDRIRMEEHTGDAGVFIRSMASRGSRGGLALATVDACDAMDAFGLDEVLVETVGVGQAELDVVAAADTVIVVLCPGAGDGVQAMKAGILEIADVLVVNKADLPGADRLTVELEDAASARASGSAASADPARAGWTTPVVVASAGKGQGMDDVLAALDRHREHLDRIGLELARAPKRVQRVRQSAAQMLGDALWSDPAVVREVEGALAEHVPPYDVARRIAARLLGGATPTPRS